MDGKPGFVECYKDSGWRLYSFAYEVYSKLPKDELEFVIGFILCFFGGTYVALIAAVEAFRTMGGHSLYDDLGYIKLELNNVLKAHDEDELVDANRDGVRDVDAMEAQELVQHKAVVVMTSIKDPQRLQGAVGNLWSAWLAVIATLSLKFAQTTAYALAISEMLKFPVTRVAAPPLTYALGKDLVKWVDVIIDSCLKVGGPEDRRAVESKLRALLTRHAMARLLKAAVWCFMAVAFSWYTGLGQTRPVDSALAKTILTDCGLVGPASADILDAMTSTEDNGGAFLMMNFIRHRKEPLYTNASLRPAWVKTSRDAELHYFSQLAPHMFRRAGHPLLISTTVSQPAIFPDVAEAEKGKLKDWDFFGMVRYRSRWDFLHMICESSAALGPGALEELKFAAVERTYVVPVPCKWISYLICAVEGQQLQPWPTHPPLTAQVHRLYKGALRRSVLV
ncbi:unnamed protein product [Effrenium voratum]|nr:unnamed protein product [Effrenium voratum]